MLATGALLASMLAVVNSSLVNAVPLAIANHLAAEPAQVPWILNAFYAPLAGLLLVAGAAGDRLGRTRLLLAGAAAMAAGALVAGLADGVAVFVTGRAIQGVGAALLMPNSLATLTELFNGPARARMVGLWSAGAAAASSAGPAIGGWLSETGYWRWIFMASLPVAAVVSALVAVGEHSAGGEMAREPQPDASAWIPLTRLASTAFVGLSVFTFLLYGVFFSLMVLLPHLLSHVIGWSASAAGASSSRCPSHPSCFRHGWRMPLHVLVPGESWRLLHWPSPRPCCWLFASYRVPRSSPTCFPLRSSSVRAFPLPAPH